MTNHELLLLGKSLYGFHLRRWDIPRRPRAPTIRSALCVPADPPPVIPTLTDQDVAPPAERCRRWLIATAKWSLLLLVAWLTTAGVTTYHVRQIEDSKLALAASRQARDEEMKLWSDKRQSLVWCEQQVRQHRVLAESAGPQLAVANARKTLSLPPTKLPVGVALAVGGLSAPPPAMLAKATTPPPTRLAMTRPSGQIPVASDRRVTAGRRKV